LLACFTIRTWRGQGAPPSGQHRSGKTCRAPTCAALPDTLPPPGLAACNVGEVFYGRYRQCDRSTSPVVGPRSPEVSRIAIMCRFDRIVNCWQTTVHRPFGPALDSNRSGLSRFHPAAMRCSASVPWCRRSLYARPSNLPSMKSHAVRYERYLAS